MKKFAGMIVLSMGLLAGSVLPVSASDPARDPEPENELELSTRPILYQSETGEFQITFPTGCGKLVTRYNEPDLFGGEQWAEIIQVNYVFCDRNQTEGEGCSINATYNLHREDGTMAGPANVIEGIKGIMQEYGVSPVGQVAMKKDFGNGIIAEGVEVRARAEIGPGEVLIRGLLIDGDIYLLAAWGQGGNVWENPDYLAFFNSFQPWVE